MNVPRDRMNSSKGDADHAYRTISVSVYSNGPASEADIFRSVVNQVVARNRLPVDRELLDRYIDQRIQSGDMLKQGDKELSGMLEPWALGKKKKGFRVEVDPEFQEVIAAFAKSPAEKLKEMERQPGSDEKPGGQAAQAGDSNATGKTAPDGGASSTPPPGDAGQPPPGASVGPPCTEYGIPPGKTLSEVAGGRGAHPIDVTLSQLASSAYDNDKYGPPPPGWRAINGEDIAKKLGVEPDDPKVSEWFRQYLGGKYALEGDLTKQHEFKAEIFTDDKGNFVLSYRGTAEGWDDWTDNNFWQGVGFNTDSGSDKFSGTAVSTAQEFARMFGQYDASGKPSNMAIVGHSQGGGLATMGSLTTGIPAVTFDASGIHANTLARINMTPEAARKYAEEGGIRAYSLSRDALTNLQENSILGIVAPDAIGTKFRVDPAKDKEGRLMEHYGEVETGFSTTTRIVIDKSKPVIFLGTIPLLGPGSFTAAGAPDSLISHSPKALTDALIDRKPWEQRVQPIPSPRPTPTPTPNASSAPASVVDSASPGVAPVPQPRPTPVPRTNPDQSDQRQSVVRTSENFEGAPILAASAAAGNVPNTTGEPPSLVDPAHPRHAMFRQALGQIDSPDAGPGRGADDVRLRLAAGMTADARANGLETIAFVQFSQDGRRFYVADMPDPSLPWARTAVGDVDASLKQSVGDSTERIAQSDRVQTFARESSAPAQQGMPERDDPVIRKPNLA